MINKKLEKWAENKRRTLLRWSEEYDRLCKEEGIKDNSIICLSFDRDYVSSMTAFDSETRDDYLVDTPAVWKKDGKLITEGKQNEKEDSEEE